MAIEKRSALAQSKIRDMGGLESTYLEEHEQGRLGIGIVIRGDVR